MTVDPVPGPGAAPPVTPNTVPALIRTVVPLLVGAALSWLASRGFDLTAYENAVNVYLVPVLGGLYYAAILAAEKRWPWAGWLLGYARAPRYDARGVAPKFDQGRPLPPSGNVRTVVNRTGRSERIDQFDRDARRTDPRT